MTPTVHLLALPNGPTTDAYCLDGFSQMTMRMAALLKRMGHRVVLYGPEANTAPCDEHVSVISMAEFDQIVGTQQYQYAEIREDHPLWQLTNPRLIAEIGKRKQPHDYLFTIGGYSQKPVTDAHPDLMDVEYSIGYVGNYARHRVFQSRAWQHTCYGAQGINTVRFYDTVIPGFFDETVFPVVTKPEPYIAYCGRVVPRKGLVIACQAAQIAGVPLKIVGHGDPAQVQELLTYGEFLGPLGNRERNEVLANASAVYCPTTYLEPYNCVAVEAQLCGTPVISTPMGGFTETVENARTGFHCHLLREFVGATQLCLEGELDRTYIRERAARLYGMEAAAANYGEYMDRLQTLWSEGWYSA